MNGRDKHELKQGFWVHHWGFGPEKSDMGNFKNDKRIGLHIYYYAPLLSEKIQGAHQEIYWIR